MNHIRQCHTALLLMAGAIVTARADVITAPSPSAPVAVTDAGTVAVPADTAPTAALNLDDAITLALQHNETVAESQAGVSRARTQARTVAAQGLPQASASASALRQKESVANLGASSVVISPATSKSASLSASQILDVFGLVRRSKDIADIATRIQVLNVARSRSEVIYQTRVAYYTVLRAGGAIDVAQAAVADAAEQLRLARANKTAGTAPGYDVVRAEVQYAQQEQQLVTARDSLDLAAAALNDTLGRAVDTPVRIAAINEAPDRAVDMAAQAERALEARPEVVQADLSVRSNSVNVGLKRLGNYPTLSAVAGYSYNFTASGLSANKDSWDVGVNVQFPILDGGATHAEVRSAQADVRIAELQRDQLRRGVTLQVRQAGLAVQEAADRFNVADKAVGQAEEALRIARVRYQGGVATQLEVTDAETQLVSTRQTRNSARYDYYAARAAFDASVTGRLGA